MRFLAIIPAFNEERTILSTLKEVKKYAKNILVVDDGSTDKTYDIAKDLAKTIRHPINLGQGAAIQTGFDYALKYGFDIVVTFDADGQFLAKEIPLLINLLVKNNLDIVFGSRFLGKTINIPPAKKLTLKAGIFFTYLFSGIKLSDTHNGFRALNKKAFSSLRLTQNRMAHASEIIHQAKSLGLKFCEAPVTVIYTDYSLSKGQKLSNSARIVLDLLKI